MFNLKALLSITLMVSSFLVTGQASAQILQTKAQSPGTVEVASLITAVAVRGNNTIESKKILDVIFSRAGEAINQEKLRADLKAVHGLGFFSDTSLSFEAFNKGTRLVFVVAENPRIDNIIIEGNTVYATAEILSWLKTKTGQLLNYPDMQGDIEKINTRYKTDGYLLARVADVNTDDKSGRLRFKIIEGQVESIGLEGNDITHDNVILRELKTRPGAVLNEKKLKADLRRVFNLGFFSEVTPAFEPGTKPDKVVLGLKIKETRTSTINFGGGYGERDGWFGFIDLSINNLLGTAQGLMIRGQNGQALATYQFKYTNPWFIPERLGDHAAFTFRRWLTIGRDIYLSDQNAVYNGFDLSLGKPLTDYFNIAWTLGSELVTPHNTSSFESYQSDTIGLTLSYDTRDFWLNPKEGRYYSLAFKNGWKNTSGTLSNFFKTGLDLNHYYPLFDSQVFAIHLGTGIGLGDIPIGEEYWIGNANTVRGYQPSESRKGRRKLLANVEYRWNFSDLFQGVFFYDWGNTWNAGGPDFNQFITGWGPGVRVNTPLGPIRLDWGVPMGKTFGEGVMHFSIGQAF
ncbi:BamA/TamA family outer membrane protein [Candidatus Saganbacteria bacterium]|nr:BamA/TamA family outer membrane protein [Candidatus Saganbacteria bacterium]